MHAQVTPGVRRELAEWLGEALSGHHRVLIKDPRAVWVPHLWVDTAAELRSSLGFLTMLRHPAEVLGSRHTYYKDRRPWMDEWGFSVMHLCGWINGNLIIERQTRDQSRAFLRYDDLLTDWRHALRRPRELLNLELDHDLGPQPHEVDNFIDADLSRHRMTWDELDMPPELVDIAEGVWQAINDVADRGGHDVRSEAALDSLSTRYADLYRRSAAISVDAATARVRKAQREASRKARKRDAVPHGTSATQGGAAEDGLLARTARFVRARLPDTRS